MSPLFLFYIEQESNEYKILCPWGYLELNFWLFSQHESLNLSRQKKASALEAMKPQKWTPLRKWWPFSPRLLSTSSRSHIIIRGHWLTSSKRWCCLFSHISDIIFLMKPQRWMRVHRTWTPVGEFLRNPASPIMSAHYNLQSTLQ